MIAVDNSSNKSTATTYINTMEPALDVLNRSLHGDSGARSFLDRTTSIYVLDATDISRPKTYGCWNFIHQAINEVERAEAGGVALAPHLQLLASLALRVARRSNTLDKQLVATCIQNAAQNIGERQQTLIDINVEIRDIVMGRIAALALDPSFHQHHSSSSAFSDAVVMETFCAVLAANAVSNGPAAVDHLVSEWIVPSSHNLPPFCLACVVLHLGLEASRKSAPALTLDMLQRLSLTVMTQVLAPVLATTVKETGNDTQPAFHERNSRIAALSLRAMDQWCLVTDLSLAQIKHVCSKVQINVVDVLSDAMYSDSGLVVEALAEFMEHVVERHIHAHVSDERMTQVRYIMQVDEASFRSNISSDQLVMIESKEMTGILEEIVSAIGLQRFRFVDRQANGDHDVCRNLTRLAASICAACTKLSNQGRQQLKTGPGLLDLLIKSASHPSVQICAISLEVLTQLLLPSNNEQNNSNNSGLAHQLLPILQRRAITPHQFGGSEGNFPSLVVATDHLCGVNIHDFQLFRETALSESLVACWNAVSHEHYFASCTAAIEEFCSVTATVQVSFHLEAALFCMEAVAEEALAGGGTGADFSSFLERCSTALGLKPESLSSNPFTLAQACRFVRKYDKWFSSNAGAILDTGADLALSTFNLCATTFPEEAVSVEMKREVDVSPYKEAALALDGVLCQAPQHFLSNQAIAALGAGWEASYAAANRAGILALEDRKAICHGICQVLASLPEGQREKSLLALAMPALDCLETMLQHASEAFNSTPTSQTQLESVLDRISSEIIIITTMARAFTDAFSIKDSENSMMQSGCRTSDGRAALVEPALVIIKRAWNSITRVACTYNNNGSISESLGYFLTQCLPPECNDDLSVSFVKELFAIATSITQSCSSQDISETFCFQPVLDFLHVFVKTYGDIIDKDVRATIEGRSNIPSNAERGREVGKCLETLLLETVAAINSMLGATWTSSQRQGQGQPAFESKSEPVNHDSRQTSNRALASMFFLLKTCAERCPVFLLHLAAAPGEDRNEDLLLRRALESAVTSLLEPEASTSKSASVFLQATVILTQSSSDDVRNTAEELLSSVKPKIIAALVVGACGKMNAGTLEDAASLLRQILCASASPEEVHSNLGQSSLRSDEYFLLGNSGRAVAVNFLLRSSRNETTDEEVSEFLHSVWELHQIESPEPLEESDAVALFCKKYS